jgi:hypothetical protein
MKAILIAAVAALAGGAFGFLAGNFQAERQGEALALAHALEKTALCANALNSLTGSDEPIATRLLDQQLRLALESVDRYSVAASGIRPMIPNLVDSLRRAAKYAERIEDRPLARKISAVEKKITQSVGQSRG